MGTTTAIDLSTSSVILFDGVCNLCNTSVNFVMDRDRHGHFKFASLQDVQEIDVLKPYASEAGQLSTIMLIDQGKVYKRSTAALRVARRLGGLWPLLYIFIVIPPFIRNWVYDFIAANRYKWFGRQDACRVPEPHLQDRFLSP